MVWFVGPPVKEIGKIDLSHMQQTLQEVAEPIWGKDERRISNPSFEDSYSLWLRSMPPTHFGDDGLFHVFDTIKFEHPVFEQQCRDFHEKLEKQFDGVLTRSCIIRLWPGQHIAMHVDGNENLHRNCHRLIIPIVTNPGVIMAYMASEDYPAQDYVLEANTVYDTNGYVPHSVTNNGDTSRYAFVLDFMYNTPSPDMKVKLYQSYTDQEYDSIVVAGNRRKFNPELRAPLIETSSLWKKIYKAQKDQHYNNKGD